MAIRLGFLGIGFLMSLGSAWATDDSVPNDPLANWPEPVGPRSLPAREVFDRTQRVYARFGVAAEPESQPILDSLHDVASPGLLSSRLPFLDPRSQWKRFARISAGELASTQDRDSRQVPDFRVRLADEVSPTPWMRGLKARLASNPARTPLRGVRIAIDPGHMGSALWDGRTGKYVEGVVRGRRYRISEGVIALQTALLAERELQALGASVFLTRRRLSPVTEVAYEALDVRHFGREELRASSLSDWFLDLLERGPAAFDRSARVSAMFSEAARGRHFIVREDVYARAQAISAFEPDVTLVIHYDAIANELSNQRFPYTKAYVEGAFLPEELATRRTRLDFARHLLHPDGWAASVSLSEAIVGQLRGRLGLKLSPDGNAEGSLQVRPGVFARNLALSRLLPEHAISYLEVMFYNDAVEFPRLLARDHSIEIDGRPYPYSARLARAANAIVAGVREFAADLSRRAD